MTDYWNLEPMRYWAFPQTCNYNRLAKAKDMCLSGYYTGARKTDGEWAMLIKDENGQYHLRARNLGRNKTYKDKSSWVPQILEDLSYLPNNTVLIGEIYIPDREGSRNVVSVFNCLQTTSLERQAENPLHFYIFDILEWDGYELDTLPLQDRIDYLNNYIKETPYSHPAYYFEGEDLWDLYQHIIEMGGEGVVIQKKDNPYTFGKRIAWDSLKLKKELADTIDAFLDGAYKPYSRLYTGKDLENWKYWVNTKTGEHIYGKQFSYFTTGGPLEPVTKGWFYGLASSVSFSLMQEGRPSHFAWISGIPETLQKGIVAKPDEWKNKVAELSAMEVQKSKDGYSLRHGKIVSWRDDKNPEDCQFSQIQL